MADSKIDALAKDIDSLFAEVKDDEPKRKALLNVILGGMAKVESPIETIWRIIMSVRPRMLLFDGRCSCSTQFQTADITPAASRSFCPHGSDPHGRRD